MKLRSLFPAVWLTACAPAPTKAPPPPPPKVDVTPTSPAKTPVVAAPKRPVVTEYFGTRVVDDYAWLEDGKSEETKAFVAAQNALARAHVDALPERPKVRARIADLLGKSSADWTHLHHEDGALFATKNEPPKQQSMLVMLRADADVGGERVLCDPNVLDPTGKTTIDFFVPSPDKKLVAVSLSKDGTESGDVHLFDVATGHDKKETIARVNGGTAGGSLAWNADGSGFFYTRYPRANERPEVDLDFYQQVWFHKLGTPEASDLYAFGKELPRIAEIELTRSDDGKRVLAHVANGDGGEMEHHVLEGTTWKRLSRFADGLSIARFAPDGRVYAIAKKGAPRGKVVAFVPPYDKPAVDVLPEGDAVIEDLVVTKNAIYLVELAGGPSRMRRAPLTLTPEPLAREPKKPPPPKKGEKPAKPEPPKPLVTIAPGERGFAFAELPLPPVSSVSSVVRVGDDVLVRIESFTEPPAWFRYRASEHRLQKTALARKPAADMSDVEVTREICTSKDGTKVPMTVLSKKGSKRDGTAPALLTGYGGFGAPRKPRMRTMHRVWLDWGGVVAETNLRGGSEMGETWHESGKLTKKQNVFDDFAACATALVAAGYTKHERLAIHGRSNGGLLMGAALVQHPEMFRAVAAGVGIYDMLKVELSPNGVFNVTEFGTVKDEAQFRALYAYSPLHNVKDGAPYPAALFTTGANDPRVDPYHSRKMVARLQAASASERPILLLASDATGHGGGTPLAQEIEELSDTLSFLLHEVASPENVGPERGRDVVGPRDAGRE